MIRASKQSSLQSSLFFSVYPSNSDFHLTLSCIHIMFQATQPKEKTTPKSADISNVLTNNNIYLLLRPPPPPPPPFAPQLRDASTKVEFRYPGTPYPGPWHKSRRPHQLHNAITRLVRQLWNASQTQLARSIAQLI